MSGTKTLPIDDKWSVEYQPNNNDRPVHWIRYGEDHSPFEENNATVAMFYSLLEKQNIIAEAPAEMEWALPILKRKLGHPNDQQSLEDFEAVLEKLR